MLTLLSTIVMNVCEIVELLWNFTCNGPDCLAIEETWPMRNMLVYSNSTDQNVTKDCTVKSG